MKTLVLTLAIAAASLGSASALNLALAERHLSRPYDIVNVPAGATSRLLALGHRTFLSDMYWLSAVQYIGEPRANERGWDKLLPLIDLVTDLDPRHGYAYQTGGIVLSVAGRLEESDRILAKGMEKGPNWWSYPYYIAFNHWFYRGDYETGAHYALLAAETPGASANVSHLALSLSSKTGTPEDAIAMLNELRAGVTDDAIAARLAEQLKLALLERDAQALERLAARFEAERGRPIATLEELVRFGYALSLPPDPFGGTYTWDGGERRVRSSANPFRFTLRERPRRPEFHYQPNSGRSSQ